MAVAYHPSGGSRSSFSKRARCRAVTPVPGQKRDCMSGKQWCEHGGKNNGERVDIHHRARPAFRQILAFLAVQRGILKNIRKEYFSILNSAGRISVGGSLVTSQ